MIVVVEVSLYLFSRWEGCGVVGACWCDGWFSAGGDGWFYPNRILSVGLSVWCADGRVSLSFSRPFYVPVCWVLCHIC